MTTEQSQLYSHIRGFNYQPSYGSSGIELWQKFNADIVRTEVGRGKRYFPSTNAVRFWLSWDAFIREPATRYSTSIDMGKVEVEITHWTFL